MNRSQRNILALGLVAFAATCLVPPWRDKAAHYRWVEAFREATRQVSPGVYGVDYTREEGSASTDVHYAPLVGADLVSGGGHGADVAWGPLLMEWLVLAAAAGFFCLVHKDDGKEAKA